VRLQRIRAEALGIALAGELRHVAEQIPARIEQVQLSLQHRDLRLHIRLALLGRRGQIALAGIDFRLQRRALCV